MTESGDHPLFAAIYDPAVALAERTFLPKHRDWLLEGLGDGDDVLDVGAGTGAMFPYFADVPGPSYAAVEPDRHMLRRAADRADREGVDVALEHAGAADLPYDDGGFDRVLAALVFCTIPAVDAALDEIHRVLAPDGEFRFLEHVHGDGWRGELQDAVNPLWRRVAAGCNLNRDTVATLEAREDLAVVEHERFDEGVTPVRPLVRGRVRLVED